MNNTALVKWETTHKKDLVDLNDVKSCPLRRHVQGNKKSTDFYNSCPGKIIKSTEQCHHNGSAPEGCIKNIFYCEKISSKLCAEGAIRNLMNVLHCFKHDMDQFWSIVTSPVHLIPQALGKSTVPKAVVKFGVECDLIQKSL